MTPVDYVILFLAIVSALVGVWRGFTTEALSVVTLLAAIGIAWTFGGRVEPLFGEWVSAVEVRLWAARLVVFVLVLVVGGLLSWLARKLVQHSGLSGLDRLLGAVFGLIRAALLVGLAVIVIEFAELDRESWWQEAQLRPYAERVAAAVRYYAELGARYLDAQPSVPSVSLPAAGVVASSV